MPKRKPKIESQRYNEQSSSKPVVEEF